MIQFRSILDNEISPSLFDYFNRYQKVTHCFRREGDGWVVRDVAFTEQWDEIEYVRLADSLTRTLASGGALLGCFDDDRLVGFAAVEAEPFGERDEYLQLSQLHVTFEHRGKGIGTRLFEFACSAARERGARKLYISAHSSVETQAFYTSVGCHDAVWLNGRLVAAEPYDRQLEKDL